MKRRKLLCLLCLFAIITSCSTEIVNAREYANPSTVSTIEPRYIAIMNNNPVISLSNRTIYIDSSVYIIGNYTYSVEIILQRSNSSTSWSTPTNVNRWENEGSGNLRTTFSYSNSAAPNLYYRVECTIRIYNSNGSLIEEDTQYSSVVRCT